MSDNNVVDFIPKGTFTDQERIEQVRSIIAKEELTFREKGELFNEIKLDKAEVAAISNAVMGKGDASAGTAPASMSTKEIIETAGGSYNTYKHAARFVDVFPTVESQMGLGHTVCLTLISGKNYIDANGLGDDAFRQLCLQAQRGEKFEGEFEEYGYGSPWRYKDAERAVKILTGKLRPLENPTAKKAEKVVADTVEDVVKDLPKKQAAPIKKAVVKAVKQQTAEINKSFEARVHEEAVKLAEEMAGEIKANAEESLAYVREAKAKLRKKERIAASRLKGIPALMTKQEFKMIKGCLHSDRVPDDLKERFNNAFIIFSKLEEVTDWD